MLKNNLGYIPVNDFYASLEDLGLHCESKHIQQCVKKMERNGRIELLEFTKVMTGGPSLVKKAIMGDLASK